MATGEVGSMVHHPTTNAAPLLRLTDGNASHPRNVTVNVQAESPDRFPICIEDERVMMRIPVYD